MTRGALEVVSKLARVGSAVSLAITVAGTLLPGEDLPQDLPPDLMLHFGGFGVPALLGAFAARSGRGLAATLVIFVFAGAASELAQTFIPGRTVSALDFAANAVGILLGACLGWGLQRLLLATFVAPRSQSKST
jgi:hypothetical protein